MVDGDDYILPNLLEKCVGKLEDDTDIVIFDYLTLDKNQKTDKVAVGASAITAGTAPWNKLYRATLWQDTFFPEGCWYEDLGIIPFLLLKAKNICKMDEPFYVYDRSRDGSQTNTVNTTRYIDILFVLQHLKQQVMTLPGTHTDDIAGMYLEQLGYVMTLSKSQFIQDKKRTERLSKKDGAGTRKSMSELAHFHA